MHTEDFFYLGKNTEGRKVWLEKPSWDCGWYWGLGYLEIMEKDREPSRAKDIDTHTHWSTEVRLSKKNAYHWFTETFGMPTTDIWGKKARYPKGTRKCRFTSDQVFALCELMESAYSLQAAAEILHTGKSHYAPNPCRETIRNSREAERINKEVLPEIFREIAKIFDEVDKKCNPSNPVQIGCDRP